MSYVVCYKLSYYEKKHILTLLYIIYFRFLSLSNLFFRRKKGVLLYVLQ